jgi:hypothetical protein
MLGTQWECDGYIVGTIDLFRPWNVIQSAFSEHFLSIHITLVVKPSTFV